MKLKLLTVVFVGSVATAAFAETKVGVVDIQKALIDSKKGKEARAQLEKEYAEKKKKLDAEQSAVQKLQEEFQKKSAALSPKVREEKAIEIQKRGMGLQEMMGMAQQEIQKREAELTKPIVEGLKAAAEELGKKRDLDLVMDINLVLYSKNRQDVTADVIKTFDDKK